jgi:hypothetical protein
MIMTNRYILTHPSSIIYRKHFNNASLFKLRKIKNKKLKTAKYQGTQGTSTRSLAR